MGVRAELDWGIRTELDSGVCAELDLGVCAEEGWDCDEEELKLEHCTSDSEEEELFEEVSVAKEAVASRSCSIG